MARTPHGRHRSHSQVTQWIVTATAVLLLTLGAAYLLVVQPISTSPVTSRPSPGSSAPFADPGPVESTENDGSHSIGGPEGPPVANPPSSTAATPSARAEAAAAAPAVSSAPGTIPPAPGVSKATTPCSPLGLIIPDLGVDASVVPVGLAADGSLGTPSDADKRKAGWFPNSVLAGSTRGTVIMDGHTYHDQSAIFRTDFNVRARAGMAVRLVCVTGNTFDYVTSEVVTDLSPSQYDAFVANHLLYATDGPPKVVIVTCTGWSPIIRQYQSRGVLIAVPG